MQIDKMFSMSWNRGTESNYNHDQAHGKLNGLLFVCEAFSNNDEVTIKIRGKERTEILTKSLNMGLIAALSDLDYGIKTRYSAAEAISNIYDKLNAHQDFTITNSEYEKSNKHVRGVYLDLGHITLGNVEIEIDLKGGSIAGLEDETHTYTVYSYYGNPSADFYKQYDETKDFDTTHHKVRDVYFYSSNVMVSKEGIYEDIDFQLDTDNGTFLYDLRGILIASNVFGRHEFPEVQFVRLYKDDLPVPGTIRVKVTGQSDGQSLIFVKEIIPMEVSESTIQNYETLLRRVEKLEAENSELAKRYRHAGLTEKSEEMASAIEQVKASNEADANR